MADPGTDIVNRLMSAATPAAGRRVALTLPDERKARHGVVEARYHEGLLIRTDAGWRTFVTYTDLFAAHATVNAPVQVRSRVGAMRALLAVMMPRRAGRDGFHQLPAKTGMA